ncbi:MAG: hypothetical protein KC618_05405, partial [Candidatus Omnitrophica bacterium]|nr:hypothetical protein [Candidatus Omnitrophota bacterium]
MDILLLILILYSGLVVYCTGRIAQRMEEDLDLKTDDMKRAHQRRVDKKNELVAEKNLLANETHRIFTLYEITKDITKSLDEKTAFDIFQGKLREHVNFQECLLLDPLSEDLKKYQVSQEAFVFPLKSKEEKVGYLVIKGVHPKKHEIVTILGNQFALALRRVKLYKEIERIAITDSLTQLFTRRH